MDINFVAASIAWRKNKSSIGNGMFKYICCATTKKGNRCRNKPLKNKNCCLIHTK